MNSVNCLLPNFDFYKNPITLNLLKQRGILFHEETVEDLFHRVINALIGVESKFGTQKDEKERLKRWAFFEIEKKHIAFGSPQLMNAGREHASLSACTVIPVDLRKSIEEIKGIVSPYFQAAMGSGFDFSNLENPVATLTELNRLLIDIEKTTQRPPCGMALLHVSHPKILDFIVMKKHADFSEWRFNISVGLTEEFMQKVFRDENWTFKDGNTANAKTLFDQICSTAHYCGEPGIIFLDNFNKDNPVPSIQYSSVAPCAEIGLAPGEVCQFNYINLASMLIEKEPGTLEVDFDSLSSATRLLTRLLDNSVEISIANALANPEIIASKRRIGIGICGFADLLLKLHLPYGSSQSILILEEILSSINYHSKMTSVELARERGPFPSFHESRYLDPAWRSRFKKYPTRQVSAEMWETLSSLIGEFGMRNACTTVLPPTGFSSRLLHVSQSIEPFFSLLDAEGKLKEEIKAKIQTKLNKAKVISERQKTIFTFIEKEGFISEDIKEIPFKTKSLFAIGRQIHWEHHLSMLAAAARHIDESVSKTVNLPQNTSLEAAQSCFQAAYLYQLKGITIFRDGCLQERQIGKSR